LHVYTPHKHDTIFKHPRRRSEREPTTDYVSYAPATVEKHLQIRATPAPVLQIKKEKSKLCWCFPERADFFLTPAAKRLRDSPRQNLRPDVIERDERNDVATPRRRLGGLAAGSKAEIHSALVVLRSKIADIVWCTVETVFTSTK